jgi:hypothetical protein
VGNDAWWAPWRGTVLGAGEQLTREKKSIVGYEQEADDEAGDKALFGR